MGTEARVRPGLQAPERPGFPSLDREFSFPKRSGPPALGLRGADEGSGSLHPGSQPDRPESSRRVCLGTGAFPCATLFLGGRLQFW